MTKQETPQRIMCVRETEENFYVAVKHPFSAHSKAYNQFDFLADSVHLLNEGSQIFVYSRENFGWSGSTQEDEFVEHVETATKELGGIALDPVLQSVSRQAAQ